jgi:hypothetical protein
MPIIYVRNNNDELLPVGSGYTSGSGGNVDWLDPEDGEVFTVIVPEPTLTGISASYTGGDVVIGTALSALVGIVVTASYSDGTNKTVTDYTLSGEIAEGSNTITVTYEGMTATFTVTGVEEEPEVTLTSISATYTGGNVAVGTAVTDLMGITVNAHYSDGSTAPVTGYTLSGEIVEGSNTITVSYGGMTTTFVVTGEAAGEGIPEVVAPARIVTVDGVDYLAVTDVSAMDVNWTKKNYSNDTYSLYDAGIPFRNIWDLESGYAWGTELPTDTSLDGSYADTFNSSVEGDVFGYAGTYANAVRLQTALGGYETVDEYLQNTYGELRFRLKSGYQTKVIDPDKITTMKVETNNYGLQYARFGYDDLPSANIYSPATNLFTRGGNNANQSGEKKPGACMSTTQLSIAFPADTFAEFTLDNVKAYLTKNPLILWYMA